MKKPSLLVASAIVSALIAGTASAQPQTRTNANPPGGTASTKSTKPIDETSKSSAAVSPRGLLTSKRGAPPAQAKKPTSRKSRRSIPPPPPIGSAVRSLVRGPGVAGLAGEVGSGDPTGRVDMSGKQTGFYPTARGKAPKSQSQMTANKKRTPKIHTGATPLQ
jgi:hypothetical protein